MRLPACTRCGLEARLLQRVHGPDATLADAWLLPARWIHARPPVPFLPHDVVDVTWRRVALRLETQPALF